MPLGLGAAPFGSSLYGYGSIDVGIVPAAGNYIDPVTGQPVDTRFIQQKTKTYVFDSQGRISGMRSVYQLVQLAVMTVKNSSAIAGFGSSISQIQTIDQNTQQRVEDAYRDCLSALTTSKLIAIVSILVQRVNTSGLFVQLNFVDLTTGLQQSLTV